MPTVKEKEENLIEPFNSKLTKTSVKRGLRVTNGKYSKRLDDMGYRNWVDEDESPADRRQFENLLRWNIAHRNYPLLKPCISIERAYDPESEQLDYTIDLYGDNRVVKHGKLYVNRGDYLMLYIRMHPYRRKESLLARIALANIGMLVPYVRLDYLAYEDRSNQVQVTYRIVI